MTTFAFHVNLFASRNGLFRTPICIRGIKLDKLTNNDGTPLVFTSPLAATWDEASQQLNTLPNMIFEPDGSFVWSNQDVDGGRWYVDGHLFECTIGSTPRLHRVELHGRCPGAEFDRLLGCVGWPKQALIFELVLEGVALDEQDFRRWAQWQGPSHRN